MFSFTYGVLCQVWYLIVSIPDIYRLPYFYNHAKTNFAKTSQGITFANFYTSLTSFSMNYLVVCKVYTDIGGINSYTMIFHLYLRKSTR